LGIVAILLAGFLILFHFKNEKNLIAFYFLRKNKFESAGKVLRGVKNPERMIKSQEAYYYYLSGLIETQKHNSSTAEKHFKKALNTGLRMSTDSAVANLNLSGIYLTRRNKKLANYYLQESKKLDKQKMLNAQIKEIEYMMKRI
jgi:tetratricopeptide (TPR) repeat protein